MPCAATRRKDLRCGPVPHAPERVGVCVLLLQATAEGRLQHPFTELRSVLEAVVERFKDGCLVGWLGQQFGRQKVASSQRASKST